MREVTLEEIKNLAREAYWDLWNGAKSLGRDVKLYIHWTGGRYNQTFSDYHINITGEGRSKKRNVHEKHRQHCNYALLCLGRNGT